MFRALRQWVAGNRLFNSLLTGEFDNSRTGREFAKWFEDDPRRIQQRQIFVELLIGMGAPKTVVAERIFHAVMEVWKDEGALFGAVLAVQVDQLIKCDPTSPEQVQNQAAAQKVLGGIKESLTALDAK